MKNPTVYEMRPRIKIPPTFIRKILEDFEGWYIVNTNGNDLKVIKRCGVWRNQTEFVSAIDEYMKERGFEK